MGKICFPRLDGAAIENSEFEGLEAHRAVARRYGQVGRRLVGLYPFEDLMERNPRLAVDDMLGLKLSPQVSLPPCEALGLEMFWKAPSKTIAKDTDYLRFRS